MRNGLVKQTPLFARKNKPAYQSARSGCRYRKSLARERQDRQSTKRPPTSTQSARSDNPTCDTAAQPRELFVGEQSAREPSADKKSDQLRQCTPATACKRFRRR